MDIGRQDSQVVAAGDTGARPQLDHRLRASRGPLRVLVADGNRDATDSLSMLVRKWGHTVHRAYDGKTALEIAPVFQPDVLLLDIGLPELDGYSLVRHLRRQIGFQNTLMIAITGWADAAHRLLGEKAGFDLYLIKPVDPLTIEGLLLLEQGRLGLPVLDIKVNHSPKECLIS